VSEDAFEYDVAFSFTMADEPLATALNDLLSSRMKTFIYSERQRDLAGKDGHEKFSEVYGKAARLVVVFYRPEWGQTPWTRVEQQAIRQRAFDDGWDFTLFIPTVDKPSLPQWFPKTRLYVGLERWGPNGAAAAIEARVSDLGGLPQQEDISHRAERFTRARKLAQSQREFQESARGVRAASGAYEAFSECLGALVQELEAQSVKLELRQDQQFRIIAGLYPMHALAQFGPRYTNSLEDTKLKLAVYKGFPDIGRYRGSLEKATTLWFETLSYQLVREDTHCWVSGGPATREFLPDQLAQYFLGKYLDVSEKAGFERH
jgi:hypothetical protein